MAADDLFFIFFLLLLSSCTLLLEDMMGRGVENKDLKCIQKKKNNAEVDLEICHTR